MATDSTISDTTRNSTKLVVLEDLHDGWNQGAFGDEDSEMEAIKLGLLDAYNEIHEFKKVEDISRLKTIINKLHQELED
jgi:hypothetical protein